jgi:glycosyltransferase involved in cell wall biosynthesis
VGKLEMVSVIIPVYNGEKYIKNILYDLSNQILKDFEAIFIDDGSNDNSYELLVSCKECNNYSFPIRIIKQDNKGVSGARNTGIEHARGEYICFVDVDDGIMPEYLSYMHRVINRENASIVFCKMTSNKNHNYEEKDCVKVYSSNEALIRYLNSELVSGSCSLMISADVIRNNGLKFAEGYKYSEDLHMVWRMIFYSEKIVETNKKLYIYNTNEGSAMGNFNNHRMDSLKLMEHLERFFKIHSPEFYPLFKKYGKARMAWSLLWQAVYHYSFEEYREYIRHYNFKNQLKNLFDYKQKHVALSSVLYCFSDKLFYLVAKIASRKYRRA